MLFSSMIFLWIFLPIVIIVYYILNSIFQNSNLRTRVKNTFLLIASLVFYAWGGIYFLAIMIFSILVNFIGGYIISKLQIRQKYLRRFVLFITILLNLLNLGYFKYFNMIVAIIEQAMTHSDATTSGQTYYT